MNRALIIGCLSAGCLLGPLSAHADTVLGLYASVGQWQLDSSGDIGITDTDAGDLGLDDQDNTIAHIALEHPVPLLPNIMLKYADLSVDGEVQLDEFVSFDDLVFLPGETLATELDLSQLDATLYYEVLDNWLNLDLGLTIRQFSGELKAVSTFQSETVDLDAILPMVYLKGQVDLPFTGFSVKADANVIGYSGDSISDISAAVAWSADALIAFDIGVELGYRRMALDFDDLGDLQTSLTLDGPYLSLNLHF